jgi:hypothetical protein
MRVSFVGIGIVSAVFALGACGGGDSDPGSSGQDPNSVPPGQDPNSNNPPPNSNNNTTQPPPDLPAPTVAEKTFERFPGASVRGKLDAQGATDVTFEFVTTPKSSRLGWIDPKKGEFLYRPGSLTATAAEEFTYVAKANGKTSAPAKVTINVKPFDFTPVMDVRGAKESWYSYNLSINFSNAGSSNCGAQQATIANGKLLERAWGTCGTYPEISISVGPGSASATLNGSGGDIRKVSIVRKQIDARLSYEENSTDCSSYNSTNNSCSAGKSENTTAAVYLGPAPTTTTAPVMEPSTFETTDSKDGKYVDGFFLVTDAEADYLTFKITAQPQNGSVTGMNELRGFLYHAKPGFTGTDTFTVVANDGVNGSGGLDSQPATITIVVK